MQLISKYLFLITIVAASVTARAQNCEIPISVVTSPQVENVPEATMDMLNSRLSAALASDGIIASEAYGQFFITARFNHITEDVVPGPPRQVAIHSSLTLMIGDFEGQQIYSTSTFDLRGVGTSTQRALINSLKSVNARNTEFERFVSAGRDKILKYFNNNYRTILAKANRAASIKHYDEALYYACSIPECCEGYAEASDAVVSIFKKYIDNDAEMLYNKALAEWAIAPNAAGARAATLYLTLIDPSASAYPRAQELIKEIKNTVRGDYDFENREKHKDAVALRKAYIDAARQIGVAYGNGQKPTTTNLMWMK